MKIRSAIVLLWLAISFAFPTFAQEQNAVDPEMRQQIEAIYNKRVDALSKQDAAAVAAFFTQDASLVNATGYGDPLTSGQEVIAALIAMTGRASSDATDLQKCPRSVQATKI